jgi:hypothetical protein
MTFTWVSTAASADWWRVKYCSAAREGVRV